MLGFIRVKVVLSLCCDAVSVVESQPLWCGHLLEKKFGNVMFETLLLKSSELTHYDDEKSDQEETQ